MARGIVKPLLKNIVIDLNDFVGDIVFTFALKVTNLYDSTLYFELEIVSPTDYSFAGSSKTQLGAVDPLSTKIFQATITRTNPNSATSETLTLKLNVYSDSNYTTLVDSIQFNVTVTMDLIEGTLSNQTLFDFDSDLEGWTVRSAGGSGSYGRTTYFDYEGGGGCLYAAEDNRAAQSAYAERSVTIQGTTKAYMKLVFGLGFRNILAVSDYCRGKFKGISVYIDDKLIYNLPLEEEATSPELNSGESYIAWWRKLVLDLSDYIGKTVTVKIVWGMQDTRAKDSLVTYALVDHILFAGD